MSDDSEQYFLGDRSLSDLKVVELRKELEIRSLPKSGNKKELVERLQNFLRDEKAEETSSEQPQQVQKTTPTTEKNQSPSATAVPNVVAQYLAQQQIQLQAARRSADKIRTDTSVDDSTAMVQIPSLTNAEQQEQKKDENQSQTQKSIESTPEETDSISVEKESSSIEKPRVSAEVSNGSDQPSVAEAVKSFEEERTKAEEKASEDGTSSENELETNEKGEQEEEEREAEKSEEQITEPTKEEDEKDSQIKEKEQNKGEDEKDSQIEEKGQNEDEKDSQIEEKGQDKEGEEKDNQMEETEHDQLDSVGETEQSAVAVTVCDKAEPEEKEQTTESINGDTKLDIHTAKISPSKSAKTRSAVAEEELDFENEEEDEEEREEPADDGGKRRLYLQQGSPVTIKSFEQQHALAGENIAEEVTGGISTSEAIANRESEVGSLVGQLTASIKEESSKPPEGQQETTPEGFLRRRPPSPARHPPSRWIHIRNLKRPFTKAALFDLLGKFGTVDTAHFWMDSIKSTCIATYETEEQAQLARERLHNVIWPLASDLALCVEYSTEEKLKRRKAEEEREATANNSALGGGLGLTIVGRGPESIPTSQSGPTVLIQHDKKRQKEVENRKRKVEELEKSQKTLDELFKKTKTLPAIYFLPLSDEEAAKRRKHFSEIKQQSQQQISSESHRNLSGNSSRQRQSVGRGDSRRSGGVGESSGRNRHLRR